MNKYPIYILMKKVFFFHKCLLSLLKKEKRKILMHIMDEVIPISEKSKYNFLQHHELDSEEKIVNKNPFDFDESHYVLSQRRIHIVAMPNTYSRYAVSH